MLVSIEGNTRSCVRRPKPDKAGAGNMKGGEDLPKDSLHCHARQDLRSEDPERTICMDWLGRVESKRKAGEGASALHVGETFGLDRCLP